jgi:ABC-type Zn uptake system ZnuABC Zn-binding protein ZnuA
MLLPNGVAAGEKHVLCTTFPVYQIARNVAKDVDGLIIEPLLPAGLGCPHNYALTPADMRRIARADALIINGLGLEEFLGTPLKSANPDLQVIDSSSGITNLISSHTEEDHHEHSRVNPHLFTSPAMQARMAFTIAEKLASLVPSEKEKLKANAADYETRMNGLSSEITKLSRELKNRRIVQPHGVFDYLAREAGLEIVADLHEESGTPSAAELLQVTQKVKDERAAVIFVEPQYQSGLGETLSKETGVPVKILDPASSGPEDAGLDYFDKTMRLNIEVLRESLGTVK